MGMRAGCEPVARMACLKAIRSSQPSAFVTASVAERARRRWLELQGRGIEAASAAIERDIAARDARDINRADAPLIAAPDARVIDTTHFDRDAAIEAAIKAVETSLGSCA